MLDLLPKKDYMLVLKATLKPSLCAKAIVGITSKTQQEALSLIETVQFRRKEVIVKAKLTYKEALMERKVFEGTDSIITIVSERHYARLALAKEKRTPKEPTREP